MEKRFSIILIFVIMMSLIVGCNANFESENGNTTEGEIQPDLSSNLDSEESEVETETNTIDEETKVGSYSSDNSNRTLKIASAYDSDGLYPFKLSTTRALGQIAVLIYDPLITMDENGETDLRLAESYEYNEDNTSLIIHLKKGVLFHNGIEMTSKDVVFSYERFVEDDYTGGFTGISGVTAIDDYTVEFEVESVYAPLIPNEFGAFFIISEDHFNEVGSSQAYNENPVGTGPFKFVSWEKSARILFEAFEDYFKGEPVIKSVEMIIMIDGSARSNAIEVGDVDVTLISPTSVELFLDNENITLVEKKGTFGTNVIVNQDKEEFANVLVRQAIAYAIDRQRMVLSEYTSGLGALPSSIYFPKSIFGYSEDLPSYEYDLDKSRDLMVQAGYADGFDAGEIVCHAGGAIAAEVLQSQLADIGITSTIKTLETGVYYETLMTKNYSIAILRMGLTCSDASCTSDHFVTGGALNFVNYSNQGLDEKYTEAASILDSTRRLELFKEIGIILQEELPYIKCYDFSEIYAFSNDLQSITIDNNGVNAAKMSWK